MCCGPIIQSLLKCITENIQVNESHEYIREPHVGQPCSKRVNMKQDLSTMKKNLSTVQEKQYFGAHR
jgi:hypothetical protein